MKKYLTGCILTIIIFGTLTILTARLETSFDGNDTFGFPFEFYKIYGGKRDYYPPNEFSVINLTTNIIIVALISFITLNIVKKIRQNKKRGT